MPSPHLVPGDMVVNKGDKILTFPCENDILGGRNEKENHK